jgi:UbiD family decarboxylase
MGKNLRDFLQQLEDQHPSDFVPVERKVAPARYEVTALLQHLEEMKKFPAMLFERPLNLHGELSRFPLLSNLFATRRRCALALG